MADICATSACVLRRGLPVFVRCRPGILHDPGLPFTQDFGYFVKICSALLHETYGDADLQSLHESAGGRKPCTLPNCPEYSHKIARSLPFLYA